MRIGLELMAQHETPIRLGTFFETWLATAEGAARRSLGRDEYHLSLTVDGGRRLAATGRTHICQLDLKAAEMGENQARPAGLAPLEVDPSSPVIWGIRTNLYLDMMSLVKGVTARLLQEGRPPLSFTLQDDLLLADKVAPGRYLFEISPLLRAPPQ